MLSNTNKNAMHKIVLNSFQILTKQQQTAAIASKSKLILLLDKVSIFSSNLPQSTGRATTSDFAGFLVYASSEIANEVLWLERPSI